MAGDQNVRVDAVALRGFVSNVFRNFGVGDADADTAAGVLVHADVLGIDSHGVARLAGHPDYVPGLESGVVRAQAVPRVIQETSSVALLDGDFGLGGVVSTRGMELAIAKAKATGIGAVTVTNSHHYGIASHYALLALDHGMIGISMTNAAPQVAPTYGKKAMLGTNPISVVAPTGRERPFILDMATSVVAAGKAEIAIRTGKPAPDGWLIDADGRPTLDPMAIFQAGALLPLGSTPERSSHKGYGLGLAVDILCGVLSGAGFSSILDPVQRTTGHFFLALQVDAFRPLVDFVAMMDQMIQMLHAAEPSPGAERVYVHGDKEFAAEKDRLANGIPLHPSVVASLKELAAECGLSDPVG
ncbi:MAG TPA: Ldh family oxidoreductase [Chloroflexota bacterium]|nr:Ldh family oxidoreductase [Chloroflexota bacterium]